MAHLIIGHTTEETARIWVRGEKRAATCRVAVAAPGSPTSMYRDIALRADADYTGTVDFDALAPDTEYSVTATFTPKPGQQARGRFRTLERPSNGAPLSFSFVLSSCNLPVVRINTFLAFLLAAAGTAAANYSLDVTVDRWRFPRFLWLRRLSRGPVRWLLKLVAGFIKLATDLKQPGQPFLRSPFLKLAAVFGASVLEVETTKTSLPEVGDIVWTSGGTGVVASACEELDPPRDPRAWRFVVAHVEGAFSAAEFLHRRSANGPDTEQIPVGTVLSALANQRWYDDKVPSFFLHAGDQIYYDFPTEGRKPDKNEYRLAYREAWFDDDANRYLLSHWPHYMTLDDHEIADQFALDFTTPDPKSTAGEYLREATVAYREYVHSRNPSAGKTSGEDSRPLGTFWYTFEKGSAHFFVLDTRMQRINNGEDGQIIDKDQMVQLLQWMTDHRQDLKFVVTSVPFVAEINETAAEAVPTWNRRARHLPAANAPERPANPANDKWNAARFRRQRDQIIDHVAAGNIERLVFLTGDMHCCYHATMRIGEQSQRTGTGSKYDSITIHELAAGPVNQLQLAEIAEFNTRHVGRTASEIPYEIVLDRFHSEVNAALYLSVKYEPRDRISVLDPPIVPEVEWNVIRTLTDNGPSAWVPPKADNQGKQSAQGNQSAAPLVRDAVRTGEPTMGGRIRFVTKRRPGDLCPWPQ
jgi:phosphodiesterase/alkaline phosphatase D-like protein